MQSSFEKSVQRPTGQHLLVNPFGLAYLYYAGEVIARSDEPKPQAVGTPDFNFMIRVNSNGTFDIQRRMTTPELTILVDIEDSVRRVCQIRAANNELVIPPHHVISDDVLSQRFQARSIPTTNQLFQVRLIQSNHVRRVDVRFLNFSWASLFIVNHHLLTACLHGNDFAELVQCLCDRVRTIGEGQPHNYGLQSAPSGRVSDRPQSRVHSRAQSPAKSDRSIPPLVINQTMMQQAAAAAQALIKPSTSRETPTASDDEERVQRLAKVIAKEMAKWQGKDDEKNEDDTK